MALTLLLYDGFDVVDEVELADRPRGGEIVRSDIDGARLTKAYAAALVTPDGRSRHYRAEVIALENHRAVLELALLSDAGGRQRPSKRRS